MSKWSKAICISERETMSNQIVVGQTYWLDETSRYFDEDEEFGCFYKGKGKDIYVGNLKISHFKIIDA